MANQFHHTIFSLIFVSINQQQISMTTSYCPNDQRYLKVSLVLCISHTLSSTNFRDFGDPLKAFVYTRNFHTIFRITSMLIQKLACEFLNNYPCHMKNCRMAPSTRTYENCHRKIVIKKCSWNSGLNSRYQRRKRRGSWKGHSPPSRAEIYPIRATSSKTIAFPKNCCRLIGIDNNIIAQNMSDSGR